MPAKSWSGGRCSCCTEEGCPLGKGERESDGGGDDLVAVKATVERRSTGWGDSDEGVV